MVRRAAEAPIEGGFMGPSQGLASVSVVTTDAAASPPPRPTPPPAPRPTPRVLAWKRPRIYELYFTLAPMASRLRRREMAAVLAEVDAVGRARDRVLEVGAGPGTYTRHMAERFHETVAVDASAAMVARLAQNMAREGIGNVEARWGRLPDLADLPGQTFDGIVAAGVLDYLVDLGRALTALRERVRRGGWLIFTVPLARPVPRLATVLEGTLLRRSHPRRPDEVRAAAAIAGLRLDTLAGVALAGVGRTLVVRAAALGPRPRREGDPAVERV